MLSHGLVNAIAVTDPIDVVNNAIDVQVAKNESWVPIWFFQLVFGWYFLVFTEPIPKENSVSTFWYYYFGGNPFFPRKGGQGPLF